MDNDSKFVVTFLLFVLQGGLFGFLIWYYGVFQRLGDWIGGALTGLNADATVRREYSLAEAHYKQGRYAESLEEYRSVVEQHPNDMFARVRITEILILHFQHSADAIRDLEEMLPHARAGQQRAFLLNRVADLYLEHFNDRGRAGAALAEIIEQHPEGKFADAARARLDALTRSPADTPTPQRRADGSFEVRY